MFGMLVYLLVIMVQMHQKRLGLEYLSNLQTDFESDDENNIEQ